MATFRSLRVDAAVALYTKSANLEAALQACDEKLSDAVLALSEEEFVAYAKRTGA